MDLGVSEGECILGIIENGDTSNEYNRRTVTRKSKYTELAKLVTTWRNRKAFRGCDIIHERTISTIISKI
jgi:hypothetical protein